MFSIGIKQTKDVSAILYFHNEYELIVNGISIDILNPPKHFINNSSMFKIINRARCIFNVFARQTNKKIRTAKQKKKPTEPELHAYMHD